MKIDLDKAAKDDVIAHAIDWKSAGKKVAIATVIQTWGSAPRPVGSQLAIDESGNMTGSVSGGCVEGAVIQEALQIMDTNEHKILEFGVSDDQAWEVGLACGGKIRVLVERLN
ncbi:XdhC family protein [Sneathiella glossodoripedis]|uniref:XdhC family protein n=1 Tax=Sneathiella glossodoripedis TaxID=418853 RepID=UPI00055BB8E2|nr:XdhC family protein [Sneathiella glossodoripedis]